MTLQPPQIIFIVGPTATGKSALAFQLAEKMNAHVLSADSRQVYRGLEITSGADVPAEFSKSDNNGLEFFQNSAGTKLFGVNFLSPTEIWSVGLFQTYFQQCLEICHQDQKNLIVVGGSGLYSHAFHITDPHIHTNPNYELRSELENLNLEELQAKLLSLNAQHYLQDNPSDWQNPRRLIRAIEIEVSKLQNNFAHLPPTFDDIPNPIQEHDFSWIGLTAPIEYLEPRIQQRVEQRVELGAIQEVERLINSYPNQKLPAFSTTGVKEIQLFLTDQISLNELIQLWTTRERQYAKRQITWFKKREYIQWINIENKNLIGILEQVATYI